MATNPVNNELFAAGGSDKTLMLYKLDQSFAEFANMNVNANANAKKGTERVFKPSSELLAHNDTITSLNWLDHSHIFTGSLDHSANIHDMNRLVQTFSVNFKDSAVTSVSYGPLSS